MALKDRNIGFIGGGHITDIIVGNLVRAGAVVPERLIVSDPDREKLETLQRKYQVRKAADNLQALEAADFVFINVRPQVAAGVIEALGRDKFPTGKIIVSIAAGIPIKAYDVLGDRVPVVRALPNPASQIGMGIAALAFNPFVERDQQTDIIALFACLGDTVVLKEEHINAVTALSSTVMAHLFFQALIDAGIRAGLDRPTATQITYQTIVGAMQVWQQRKVGPQELISEASTPGGVSAEIVFTLEKYAFRAAVNEAVNNGVQKAAEFSHSL